MNMAINETFGSDSTATRTFTLWGQKPIVAAIGLSSVLMLSACGGSDGNASAAVTPVVPTAPTTPVTPPATPTYTGRFLDSAVQGLEYKTASQSGRTNAQGEFTYQADEKVTFSIGGVDFPEVTVGPYITPLTLFKTDDINNLSVVNMLRLLQTLDADGMPSNGIVLNDNVHQLASNLAISFSDINFETLWQPVISNSGSVNGNLITASDAIYHFQQTLAQLDTGNMNNCAKTHPKVGWSGSFQTLAHNVAGRATIIDDCTIAITHFDYDGGGPDVLFYGGINHKYNASTAFPLGNKLNGREYKNVNLTIKLPVGKTMTDLTGLSVWCVDFNADFGHMEFTP